MPPMNRRDALKATTTLVGAVLAVSSGALVACAPESRPPRQAAAGGVLNSSDEALVEAIADTLLPATAASPGAKAAGAGPAINLLLTDCYERTVQQRVVGGLQDFRVTCRTRYGQDFASLALHERTRLLGEIDTAAQAAGATHYFGHVRELALRAYFSSELGMTRALRYVREPGRWEGCVPRSPGQPAWA